MSHNCDCGDATDQIYEYLDSELDQETAASIRAHLEDCPDCFDSFDFERRLKVVIRKHLGDDMPSQLEEKVKALIRRENA